MTRNARSHPAHTERPRVPTMRFDRIQLSGSSGHGKRFTPGDRLDRVRLRLTIVRHGFGVRLKRHPTAAHAPCLVTSSGPDPAWDPGSPVTSHVRLTRRVGGGRPTHGYPRATDTPPPGAHAWRRRARHVRHVGTGVRRWDLDVVRVRHRRVVMLILLYL